MPIDVKFSFPAPLPRPRPVSSVLDPIVVFDITKNTVAGGFRKFYESTNPESPDPVLDTTRVPFTVILTDADMEAILAIVAPRAMEQGILPAGSTPTVVVPPIVP
jgi:hypothetical protein